MANREHWGDRLSFYRMDSAQQQGAFARDVAQGLSAPQKTVPPKYFYDARGSQLYEQICTLPEYYPYRAEREIFTTYAADIVAAIDYLPLVEFGPGNAAKTRYLLSVYEQAGVPFLYCPVDISLAALEAAAEELLAAYPHIAICAIHADFTSNLRLLEAVPLPRKALAFFGSNLGNFTRAEGLAFLQQTAALMGPEDAFLLGLDLKKSPTLLVPAYDDARGVTAAFNLNLLHRMNRELGANFDVANFVHMAWYNAADGRMEMHLRSCQDQCVTIAATGQTVHFAVNETLHTENSHKYSVADVQALGQQVGLQLCQTWFDRQHYFLLALLRRTAS